MTPTLSLELAAFVDISKKFAKATYVLETDKFISPFVHSVLSVLKAHRRNPTFPNLEATIERLAAAIP